MPRATTPTETVSNQTPKSLRLILKEMLLLQSQSDLAKKLGVSQHWIHNHTNGCGGRVQPSLRARLAKRMGIDPLEFARICERHATENSK